MYAVIKSGGRQYQVAVGDTLEVNRLAVEDGEEVRFEEVLLISNDGEITVGTPLVSDAVVLATAVKQDRGPKLIVFKYKPKKRYRHKRGHRQELTILSIDDIVANGKSLVTGKAPEAKAPIEEEESVEAAQPAVEEAPAAEEEQPAPEKKTRRRRTAKAEESAADASEE